MRVFEAGDRLGFSASERVSLADYIRDSFHRDLVWGWYIWTNMHI